MAVLSPEVDVADGDPLDVCVVSERPIDRAEVMLDARVVGGMRMIDHGEAHDKIIAVLKDDPVWSDVDDLTDLPEALVRRLEHYFLTYKTLPGEPDAVSIPQIYDKAHACAVVEAARADYGETFGGE